MQNNIGNESADEIGVGNAGIEQRRIEDEDIRADDLGNASPFVKDHVIIAAEPVDVLDDKQIAGSYFFDHAVVFAPFKVFTALFIGENAVEADAAALKASNCLSSFWSFAETRP